MKFWCKIEKLKFKQFHQGENFYKYNYNNPNFGLTSKFWKNPNFGLKSNFLCKISILV